ncbi:MAG: 50S ribosomal protein L17 [Candidatus Omnitrophica bacterium]|nr:50S ribosomal protein L17 [Candidatus Omnitrophota bacterium]
MRHAKKRLQLSRFTSWHDATIRSLARNMVICQSITTTLTRAKASKQMIEKLVTLGKKNTLFARRQAQKVLGEHKLVNLLFNEIAPRFTKRNSGFTRIIGLGKRRGDNAEMVIFEFTELKIKETKKPKPAKEDKSQEALGDIEAAQVKSTPEQKKEIKVVIKDKPIDEKKPQKKFMGGLRTIFKKKSDSL